MSERLTIPLDKPIKAYHFFGSTLLDGSPVPDDGVELVHNSEVSLCRRGYHASLHPYDALKYAPDNNLALVQLAGGAEMAGDKLVAQRRTIVARVDATALLRRFARECALDVIHLWDAPTVVRRYLGTGDDTLRWSAEDAARAAAWAAAKDAAWAARAAAWAAAGDAAEAVGAAEAAARAVWAAKAVGAAEAAAEAAAWATTEAAGRADSGVAEDAIRDAQTVQRQRFGALVDEAFDQTKKGRPLT